LDIQLFALELLWCTRTGLPDLGPMLLHASTLVVLCFCPRAAERSSMEKSVVPDLAVPRANTAARVLAMCEAVLCD